MKYVSAEPHEIFVQAEYFQQATQLLAKTSREKNAGLVIPASTCGSFALELFIKCLLAIQNPKNEFPAIHSLSTLYSKLNEEDKTLIEFFFSHISKGESLVIHQRALRAKPLTPGEEVAEILRDNDEAFEGYRYAFGFRNDKLPETHAIRAIREAVRQRILALFPAWKDLPVIKPGYIKAYSREQAKEVLDITQERRGASIAFDCLHDGCNAEIKVKFDFIKGLPRVPGVQNCPPEKIVICSKCGSAIDLSEVVSGLEAVYQKKLIA